jgi:hypothetical protein
LSCARRLVPTRGDNTRASATRRARLDGSIITVSELPRREVPFSEGTRGRVSTGQWYPGAARIVSAACPRTTLRHWYWHRQSAGIRNSLPRRFRLPVGALALISLAGVRSTADAKGSSCSRLEKYQELRHSRVVMTRFFFRAEGHRVSAARESRRCATAPRCRRS